MLRDLHAHARGAINRRCNTDDNGCDLNGCAVRTVRAYVQAITATDLLIEMKKGAGVRDIVSFGGLAPGRIIVRAA
jgi:hypothetical protein